MSDRDDLLKKISKGLGPPWWRPFKRRSWNRLMRVSMESSSHWASIAEEEAVFLKSNIRPVADQVLDQLNETLEPYGLVMRYEATPHAQRLEPVKLEVVGGRHPDGGFREDVNPLDGFTVKGRESHE